MAQHDFNIANQTFPATRTDLNNALEALATLSSGPTAPSATYANMLWYDSGNNILKMRSEADDAWINVGYLCQSTNKFCILDDTNVVNTSGTQTGLLGDQATSAWEAGTSTTKSLVSPANVKAAVEALVTPTVDTQIGDGQSWGGVSLSSGVAVQNTEGRSIQISITVRPYDTGTTNNPTPNASSVQVSADGSSWVTLGSTVSSTRDSDGRVNVTAVVPDQHYYRYNGSLVNAAVLS